jgi:hypothetical protein
MMPALGGSGDVPGMERDEGEVSRVPTAVLIAEVSLAFAAQVGTRVVGPADGEPHGLPRGTGTGLSPHESRATRRGTSLAGPGRGPRRPLISRAG